MGIIYEIMRKEFNGYYTAWQEETKYMSNMLHVYENEHFRSIVNMRWMAIPFLLEKVEKEPDLCRALFEITGHNAIKKTSIGNKMLCAKDWVEWNKKEDWTKFWIRNKNKRLERIRQCKT